MKQIVLCIAVMILVSGCSAYRFRLQLCGRDLAEVLSIVCGVYHHQNELDLRKRSLRRHPPAFDSVPKWLLSQSTSTSSEVEKYRSRQRRGIVDDCCVNSCSFKILLDYCAEFGQVPDDSRDSEIESDVTYLNLPIYNYATHYINAEKYNI